MRRARRSRSGSPPPAVRTGHPRPRRGPPACSSGPAAALGERRPRLLIPKRAFGETFGAAGVLGLLAAGAEAGRGDPVLVLDVCPTGHVAALVASVPEAR